MAIEEELSITLKHIRFVHFSLLTISAAVLYFVFISWSPASDARAELERFSSKIELVKTNPASIFDINPAWFQDQVSLLKQELSEWVDPSVIPNSHFERWVRTSVVHEYGEIESNIHIASLEELRAELSQSEWKVTTIGNVLSIPNLDQWFVKQRKTSERYDDFYIWLDRTFDIGAASRDGGGTVTASVRIEASFQSTDDGPWSYAADIFQMSYSPKTASHQMADNWFELEYPNLQDYWEQIRSLEVEDALDWVANEQTRFLKNQTISIVGAEFRAEYIGFIGPTAVFCVLLYLVTHINHVSKRLIVQVGDRKVKLFFVPWIGCMNGILPQTVTGASLLVVLPLAVFLPIWRLTGFPNVAYVVLAVSMLLGWLTFCSSRAIARALE